MTTASIRTTSSVRPKGVDGLAVRLGLAIAEWGRVRAARSTVDHAQAAERLRTETTVAQREHNALRYGIAS